MSAIRLANTDPVDIPTPPADRTYVFLDLDGNVSLKDANGAVAALVSVLPDPGNVWEAETAVVEGYRIAVAAGGPGWVFEVDPGGTTGVDQPDFSSVAPGGSTDPDGDVEWNFIGFVGQPPFDGVDNTIIALGAVNFIPQGGLFTEDFDADGFTVKNLPEPDDPDDAATKAYADALGPTAPAALAGTNAMTVTQGDGTIVTDGPSWLRWMQVGQLVFVDMKFQAASGAAGEADQLVVMTLPGSVPLWTPSDDNIVLGHGFVGIPSGAIQNVIAIAVSDGTRKLMMFGAGKPAVNVGLGGETINAGSDILLSLVYEAVGGPS